MDPKDFDDRRSDNLRTFFFRRVKKLPKMLTKIKELIPPSKYKSRELDEYYLAYLILYKSLIAAFKVFEIDVPASENLFLEMLKISQKKNKVQEIARKKLGMSNFRSESENISKKAQEEIDQKVPVFRALVKLYIAIVEKKKNDSKFLHLLKEYEKRL